MTYISEKLSNGNTINYQITESGTAYYADTNSKIIEILERARYRGQRLKIYLGNIKTGEDWMEENDIIGYIGRSSSIIKIPILLTNSRSYGGGAILTDCIVKIKESKGGTILYQHSSYFRKNIEIVPSDLPEYKFNILLDGELYSRHKTLRSAQLLKNKLS